jgi:cation/acetate symporter
MLAALQRCDAIFAILLGVLFGGQTLHLWRGSPPPSRAPPAFLRWCSIVWRPLPPAAVASILTVSSLVLICLSPTVQVDVLGKTLVQIADAWWFVPLRNPAIVCMPLSFVVAIVVSLVTRERNADQTFDEMRHRVMFGSQPATNVETEADRTVPGAAYSAQAT